MNSLSALMLTLSTLNGAPQGELLDFTSQSCPPCRAVAPIVERLHRKGYPIRKIDVNKHPGLAKKYGVRTIPQFILVINGKPKKRLFGPQSETTLVNLMAQIPKPAPEQKPDNDTSGDSAVAADDRPSWRRGIPIPFLGKGEDLEAEDIETVRGQNEETDEEPTEEVSLTADADEGGPATADPMSASVRLRVNQRGTVNFGTGTIIESRPSRSLVISCGHIFRGIKPDQLIDVDYFDGQEKTTWKGKVLRYDSRADVGLIAVQTDRLLPSIKISDDPSRIRKRDLVSSVGCGNGNPPTRWQMFVQSVDQFVGSSIIECTHAPLSGRSGGGLFNRRGELIGICMAADRERDSGLYAGLKEIHKLLDESSLTSLYRKPDTPESLLAKTDAFPEETEPESKPPQKSEQAVLESPSPSAPGTQPMPKITPKKVPQLSRREIDAVAAALQTSGKRGVTITIEPLADAASGYQVVIENRAEPLSELSAATTHDASSLEDQLARREQPPRDEIMNWDNLLERRETRKPDSVELSEVDFPAWAQ